MNHQYLVIPEDIKASWAKALMTSEFHQAVSQNPGRFVRLGVMVREGLVTAVSEPVFSGVEPRKACAEDGRSNWWSVVRRLMSVAGEVREGLIEIRVLIGQNGEPVMWEKPGVCEWRKVG